MQLTPVFSIKAANSFDCLILVAFGNQLGHGLAKLDPFLAVELDTIFKKSCLCSQNTGFETFTAQVFGVKTLIFVVQFGSAEKLSAEIIRRQLTAVVNFANKSEKKSMLFCWPELSSLASNVNQYYQLLAQYCQMTEYQCHSASSEGSKKVSLEKVVFFDPRFKQNKSVKQYLNIGKAIASGINLSKSFSNLPANVCTPAFMANQAVEIARDSQLKTTVIDEAQMKSLKMNCILAVSAGSQQQAKFIQMQYSGANADQPVIVLIGKGVTFDSGGYSLKSAPGMHEMKFDMCGAATVMGTMHAISLLKIPINIIALMPCSENLINGRAFKPGDILTSMSGQTVEILSTDAEGRLLLADALTFSKRFNPALVIDVATLTGAAITALGHDISAMMSNNKTLSKQIYKAGIMCQDHVWPLPIWEEYSEILNSNFADMASSAGRSGSSGAGATVAACFLSKFIDEYRWAHLDVAGTAWHRGKHLEASGRPVALLCQFLINYCNKPF